MAYFRNVQHIVGNTPLVELSRFTLPNEVRLFAKLEFMNPGGSVKDRLGLELLESAFESGKLKPGGTIIEPTAGNTGIGLALAAIGRDVSVLFVVPEKFSTEKQQLMKALGAQVINTPTELGMLGAIHKAEQLAEQIPGGYSPAQFSNPANPATYYKTLAPEIWRDMDGELDIFVAGAGSGGTFMGTAAYLKERNRGIRTVIVEPEGSILAGGKPGSHKTEGIGVEKLAPFMDTAYFDGVHTISDEDAFQLVKELALVEGLLVGSSSGAAMKAALLEAEHASPGSRIVTVFPDGSDRYLSKKIYEGGL
ncbi:PLP-dependent cysteine synthase family protein [Paenibacillus sp. NEAU-GSW1]|uniref:PLP-dependent cysteine synthase family protein n=1 Tax=Paenibacillus sp. NEAU-GSW1 TaxID=2682486 RepID=UPI0012E0EC1E|nr:cysteine synthase family protein [Paenibacillus sp. NEAU-GSW1]MUT67140.1 pyridoxal-phosphate dependent enzyme [Paenibacillus sp. NEAU-GSW1]